MSKIVYLITILSVVLFKSETSFAQELKKDLGVCGKTFAAILEMTTTELPQLKSSIIQDDEFCDIGRYEQNANFIISLFNANNELVYDKKVYLNTAAFAEAIDSKMGSFQKTKIKIDAKNSRIINFPKAPNMGELTAYKVKSLETGKESALTKIKW